MIEDVSVNINGKSVITWSPSAGSDFYLVYIQDFNGAWILLDSVSFGANSYLFDSSLAIDGSESFTVRAIDSCGNNRGRSDIHNSIFITYDIDVCDYSVFLDWNDYINWEGGLSHYNIFITATDDDGVVTSNVIRANSTDFLLDSLSSSSQYDIYIEAYNFDSTFVAVSSSLDLDIALASKPKFHYIEYVSVNPENGFIELNCYTDNTGIVDHYDVYRSKIVNEIPVAPILIDNIAFNGTSSIHYTDNSVSTSDFSYLYTTYPVDTCGVVLNVPPVDNPTFSNDISYAQSILLNVEVNKDYSNESQYMDHLTNTLVFNKYDKWLGNVKEYQLFRSVDDAPFSLLATPIQPNQELVYIDIVTSFESGNGKFCYYVKAVEGNNTPYGPVIEGSLSNVVCITQTPNVFVPNTFTPNGDEHNEIFRPLTYFVAKDGYVFCIYNRQGAKIFETDNPKKGWDGSYMSLPVQNGNYIYHIQFLNGLGDLTEKRGVVNLVR